MDSPAAPAAADRPQATSVDVFRTLDLALRIGEVLLSSGAGAADVRAQMDNVAHACGLRGYSAEVTFTELTMSHQAAPDEPAFQQSRQVRRRVIDYANLTAVDHLVRELVAGEVTRDAAATRVNRITSSGHTRPRWSVSVALGVMGAGIALMLGGEWLVVVVAVVAAFAVDHLQRQMARLRWPTFYQQVAGGLLATLVAVGVAATGVASDPSRVITAAILLLLTGVSFLGAIQDALTGYPLTAGARLLEAVIATAGIVAGVSGGLQVAHVTGVDLGRLDPGAVVFAGLPLVAVGAGLTAAAYAFSAYAPLRSLLPIAVIGAAAGALYLTAYRQGFSIVWASAVGALFVGLVSYAVSGRARVPALVVVTAGLVPMLPGLSIYRGLTLLADGSSTGLIAMVNAAAIAIALSSGAILGEYIAQPLKREARRVEQRLSGPRLVGPISTRSGRRQSRRTVG